MNLDAFLSEYKTELTPRGQNPLTPRLPPLPEYMQHIPYGLDESGKPINDIRGNVIKPVITTMLEAAEKRGLRREEADNSVVIQRRTPATRETLGDAAWFTHIASGCHTLRGALASFPYIHSKQPHAEIEETQCLLRGDDCCEWKFIWQAEKRRGLFGWIKK